MKNATVETFLIILKGQFIAFDRRQSYSKYYYNPYALPQYLATVDNIRADVTQYLQSDEKPAIEALKAAIDSRFPGNSSTDRGFLKQPINATIRKMDRWIELGKLPSYPISKLQVWSNKEWKL